MTTTKHDRVRAILTIRAICALALFAIGFDHLYEYTVDHYSAIPTIGTLFLLNTIGGFALGIAVLIPTERFVRRRVSELFTLSVAAGGFSLAAGSLAGLFISESTPLFGFMETGYRTTIVIAIAAEVVAMMSLVALVALAGSPRQLVTAGGNARQ
jgi:hypothetical protein